MTAREFEITIRPDGTVEMHLRGFHGPECVEAVKGFEAALGEATSRQLTSEYYDPEARVQYRLDQRH